MTETPPYSHPFRVADLAPRKPTRFRLAPDDAARERIAQALAVTRVTALVMAGELRPTGRTDWELTARLEGTVVQPCVVTLAPVTTRIAETVARRYLAHVPEPEGDDIEMPEDDTVEPLGPVIDAGAVLTEALALALPLYPRAPGAALGAVEATPPGAEPLTDETVRPFARLGELLKKDGSGEG